MSIQQPWLISSIVVYVYIVLSPSKRVRHPHRVKVLALEACTWQYAGLTLLRSFVGAHFGQERRYVVQRAAKGTCQLNVDVAPDRARLLRISTADLLDKMAGRCLCLTARAWSLSDYEGRVIMRCCVRCAGNVVALVQIT